MIFLIHAPFTAASIASEVGKADYSYYFVMREYLPVLQSLGTVVELEDPCAEADDLYARHAARGEFCVLLCFAPPHRVPLHLRCPTIPVFAWEYDRIPDESWRADRETDWTAILGKLGCAITHSAFAVATVKQAIRDDYPVVSVPAPVWDRFARPVRDPVPAGGVRLEVDGTVIDSRTADISVSDAEVMEAHPPLVQEVLLEGVVYTAVFCPLDGRKNWEDMLTAFCWAFRTDDGATFVLKLVHHDREEAMAEVLRVLRRLPPCAARILVLHAFLDDEQYGRLMRATDFAVNSSLGEGQCLPLMEYMSAGIPAIAPDHTALADYIDGSCAFVVAWSGEWTNWPHDMRLVLRTRRYRPDWQSLVRAFADSRALRRDDPAAYALMGRRAAEKLRTHASRRVAAARLEQFFRELARMHRAFLPAHERPVSLLRRVRGWWRRGS